MALIGLVRDVEQRPEKEHRAKRPPRSLHGAVGDMAGLPPVHEPRMALHGSQTLEPRTGALLKKNEQKQSAGQGLAGKLERNYGKLKFGSWTMAFWTRIGASSSLEEYQTVICGPRSMAGDDGDYTIDVFPTDFIFLFFFI